MNPREFFARRKGFYDGINYNQEREWERIRWQTVLLLNVTGRVLEKQKVFDDFPFPWEKKADPVESKKITEEWKNKMRAWSAALDKKTVLHTQVATEKDLRNNGFS